MFLKNFHLLGDIFDSGDKVHKEQKLSRETPLPRLQIKGVAGGEWGIRTALRPRTSRGVSCK